jgi:hypothetical protein
VHGLGVDYKPFFADKGFMASIILPDVLPVFPIPPALHWPASGFVKVTRGHSFVF